MVRALLFSEYQRVMVSPLAAAAFPIAALCVASSCARELTRTYLTEFHAETYVPGGPKINLRDSGLMCGVEVQGCTRTHPSVAADVELDFDAVETAMAANAQRTASRASADPSSVDDQRPR